MQAKSFKAALKFRNPLIAIGLAIAFACGTSVVTAQGVQWESDINRAVKTAKDQNRLIFIHFYGSSCPPCKAMDANVFPDARVVAEMNRNFVSVRADIAQNVSLAKRLDITAVPTDIVLDSNGQLLYKRQGGIAANQFLEFLTFVRGKAGLPDLVAAAPAQTPAPPVAAPSNALVDPFTRQPVLPPASEAAAPVQPQPTAPPLPPQPAATPAPAPAPAASPFPVVAAPAPATVPVAVPVAVAAPAPALERVNPVRPPEKENASIAPDVKETVVTDSVNCESFARLMVEVPLGLEGYCPVVLGKEERWVHGNPAYYAMFRGQIYRFSSEESMGTFLQTPMKFAPVAMGEDVVLMVDKNKKSYGTRKFGAWFEGRVYLFTSQETLQAFAVKPEFYAEIAQKYETAFKTPLDSVQR